MANLELNNFSKSATELATELQSLVVDGAEKIWDCPTYVTFRKFGTECTLNAEWEVAFGEKRVLIKDEATNEFLQASLRVTVSHQSHASEEDLDLVINRAKFILECCEAARRLREANQVKKVYHVWDTVEGRELRAREDSQKAVREAVISNVKGLRVNQCSKFCDGSFSDRLLPGEYNVAVHSKKYLVTVDPSKVVLVTRTV